MTAWNPRHSHITQIHPRNGSGENDCFAAAFARYLYEAGIVPLDRDQWDLINAIDIVLRGQPDSVNNPETTLAEAATAFAHYGIDAAWTDSYQAAMQAPWSIALVDGRYLTPALYPSSWFPAGPEQANHFVLSLPFWRGSAHWLNNPLAYANGQQDAIQDMSAAFFGAYLLPDVAPSVPMRWTALRRFGLLPRPQHGSTALVVIQEGATGIDLGDRHMDAQGTAWHRLGFGAHSQYYAGWAPGFYLREAAP